MARLGDIATYINGYAFKPEDWSNDGLLILRIQDLTGNSYETNRYNGRYDPKYEVLKGDVLISWSASLGVYVWEGEKALLNQHIFKVVFNKIPINKSFFVHQVQGILEKASSETHGATMKHLIKPVFDALPFYLPPMEKQNHIASVLDKVSGLIALRKQQFTKLDELVKARFVEMFGDPITNPGGLDIVSLSKIADFYNGLTYTPSDVSKDGTIVLRSSNIQNGTLDLTDTVRVRCTIKDKYMVQENDILMCSRNGSARLVGKVAPISNISEPMCFGAFMMIIRSKYALYLLTYFQTDAFREQIKTGATTTINQITVQMLGNVYLPIPTIEEVEEYSGYLNRIGKCKLTIQRGLDRLEMLKKALMQEYFGGGVFA